MIKNTIPFKILTVFVATFFMFLNSGYTDSAMHSVDRNTLSNKLVKEEVHEEIARHTKNLVPGLGHVEEAVARETNEFLSGLGREGFKLFELHDWFGTNEEWQELLPFMEDKSGAYIGIGFGGQNLSFLAKGDFDRAVIVDSNPFVTEGFYPLRNALIEMATSRAEYISFLFGVQLTPEELQEGMRDDSLELIEQKLWNRFLQTTREERMQNYQTMWKRLEERSPEMCRNNYVRSVWGFHAFYRFNAKQMLRAARKGESWLSDDEHFYKIQKLVANNAIQAINANWFIDSFDEIAKKTGLTPDEIGAIYLSNIFDAGAMGLGADAERERRKQVVRATLSNFGVNYDCVVYAAYEHYRFLWEATPNADEIYERQFLAMEAERAREAEIAESLLSYESA